MATNKKTEQPEKEQAAAKEAVEESKATPIGKTEAVTDPIPEAAPAKPNLPKPEDGKNWYVNRGKTNHYTEVGRCMPNEYIQLTAKEAKAYEGLEECQ